MPQSEQTSSRPDRVEKETGVADQESAAADRRGTRPARRPGNGAHDRPWRTEGVPNQDGDQGRHRWWRVALWMLVAFLFVFGLVTMQDRQSAAPTISYTEFTQQVAASNVAQVFSQGEDIQGVLKQPEPLPGQQGVTYTTFNTVRPAFADDNLLAELQTSGATVSATPVQQQRGTLLNLLISIAPVVLIVLFYLWVFRRQGRMLSGGGLLGGGQRKPINPDTVRVTFDDVAGIDEVQEEISEVVDFLQAPGKYRRLGARVPKGVLLAGAPGTGKTLLARATAGEAGVPFFSASASEFIEMIVGVGAQRVRELFGEARKVAPAIIFIDEIDTIGRARGGSLAGGHDEREQTLNQILTEMDGFSGAEGVVVMAATNRPDVLDPALLRPGRFDRTIMVHPPDQDGRAAILRVHTRPVPLAQDVDLEQLARATPGMTGADLANLVNEAAILAARHGKSEVGSGELDDALEKVQLGRARSVVLPAAERQRTAYHESGHALLGMLHPGADPVRKVSIIPRGRSLGATVSTPESDRYGYDERYLRGRIIGALGGMAAENLVYGVITTGSEYDLEVATRTARAMVGRWGMSVRIGPISVLPQEGDARATASDDLLGVVDDEVRHILDECYSEARDTLSQHRAQLDAIVQVLLERETLDEAQVYEAAGIPRDDRPAPDRGAGTPSEPRTNGYVGRVGEPRRW